MAACLLLLYTCGNGTENTKFRRLRGTTQYCPYSVVSTIFNHYYLLHSPLSCFFLIFTPSTMPHFLSGFPSCNQVSLNQTGPSQRDWVSPTVTANSAYHYCCSLKFVSLWESKDVPCPACISENIYAVTSFVNRGLCFFMKYFSCSG